jgi:molybdate-binding protein
MSISNFLLGVGVGVFAYHIIKKMNEKKDVSQLTPSEIGVIAQDVIRDEGSKFSRVLRSQYDIVMPSDQVSKKVRKRAKQLTEGRYAVKVDQLTPPTSL